ncbi:MAG: hypothetical protein RLZZ476_772, partial [Verrucomicrobiota bacterium]
MASFLAMASPAVFAAKADLGLGEVPAKGTDLSLRQDGVLHAGALAHYTTALQLETAGRPKAALEHYLAIVRGFPVNPELLEHTSALLLQYEGRDAAMKLLEEAVAKSPDSPQALIQLARFASTYPPEDSTKKDPRADVAISEALKKFPRHAEVYDAAVMHHLTGGRRDQAARLLESAAALPVTDARFWLDLAVAAERVWPLGQIEFRPQHLAKVLPFFESALKHTSDADREAVQLEVAQHYLLINELVRARELCEKLSSGPGNLQARKMLFRLYEAEGEKDKMLATLEQIVQQQPQDSEYRRLIAREYEQREQMEKAAPHLEAAIQQGGELEDYLKLALYQMQAGRSEPVIHLCERALRLFPEQPRVHYFLAFAYMRTRQPAKAVARFEEAEKLSANVNEQLLNASFYEQFGAVLEQVGRLDDAALKWEKAIALSSPEDPKAAANIMNSLAYMWVEQGKNLAKAEELLAKANELSPDTPAYIDSLGWMYFKKGDFKRALTELKRAESLMEPIAPEDAEILEHIAHAHRQLGQHKQAIDYLERAAALKSPVQRMRERIEQTLRQWKG